MPKIYTQLRNVVGGSPQITSATPETYRVTAPADTLYVISRIIVSIIDTKFSAQDYGTPGPLTNGITLKHHNDDDSVKLDFLDGETIKTTSAWSAECHDATLKTWGAGQELISVRWTFTKDDKGDPVILFPGEYLELTSNDDMSHLIDHRVKVRGSSISFFQAGAMAIPSTYPWSGVTLYNPAYEIAFNVENVDAFVVLPPDPNSETNANIELVAVYFKRREDGAPRELASTEPDLIMTRTEFDENVLPLLQRP